MLIKPVAKLDKIIIIHILIEKPEINGTKSPAKASNKLRFVNQSKQQIVVVYR